MTSAGLQVLWVGVWVFAAVVLTAVSYAGACRLLPAGGLRTRWNATVVVGVWLQGLLFYGLLYAGIFTRGAAVAAIVATAVVGWGAWRQRDARLVDFARRDWRAVRCSFGGVFDSPGRWILVPALAVVAMQFVRSLVAPPLAWDDLTYHLVKAALWVQHGEFASYGAPGAWEYYLYFSPLGEAIPAWGMLFVESDIVVPLAGMAIWGAMLGAIYGLARQLDVSRSRALVASLGAGLVPAVASHVFTAYVDNLVLLLQVSATALLIDYYRNGRTPAGVLGIVGLITSVAVKPTGALLLVVGLVFAAIVVWRQPLSEKWATLGTAGLAGAAIAVPLLVFNWSATGSPVYPFSVSLWGETLFEGSRELQWLQNLPANHPRPYYLVELFWGGYHENWIVHKNFGPGTLALLPGLVWAIREVIDGERFRAPILVLAGAALLAIAVLVVRTGGTGWNSARYFAFAPVFLAVVAATSDRSAAGVSLMVFAAVNLFFFVPLNWSWMDLAGSLALVVGALPFAAVAGVALWYARGRESWRVGVVTGVAVALIGCGFVGWGAEQVRSVFRYSMYEASATGRSYQNIPVVGNHALGFASSSIWEMLDEPDRPRRIAVTAGWDGKGHNWFVYPLFGRRLQNHVEFVAVTDEGDPINPRRHDRRLERADYEAWRDRLLDREIDYVVSYAPTTIEAEWMANHPRAFDLVERGGRRGNYLFRVLTPDADS